MDIPPHKTVFLDACLTASVLTFGTYTLKSGRQSPYFFNAGSFHTAPLHAAISTAFARTIVSFVAANPSVAKPDVIFGSVRSGNRHQHADVRPQPGLQGNQPCLLGAARASPT
jgi:orotate phosphoribosyltransferase